MKEQRWVKKWYVILVFILLIAFVFVYFKLYEQLLTRLGFVAVVTGIIWWATGKSLPDLYRIIFKLKPKPVLTDEDIKRITDELERRGMTKPYLDGLPQAVKEVRDPFTEGLKSMENYKWDEAIGYFKKALEKAKGTQLVSLFNLIGLCHYTPGRLDEALKNFEESVHLAEQFDDKEGKAAALGNSGLIYERNNGLDKALNCQNESLKLNRELNKEEDVAKQLSNIALIYFKNNNLEVALTFIEESLKINRKLGNKEGIAANLGNLGIIYQNKENFIKSLEYHEESLKLYIEINNKAGIARSLLHIGTYYLKKGNINKTLEYFQHAIDTFKQIGAESDVELIKKMIQQLEGK